MFTCKVIFLFFESLNACPFRNYEERVQSKWLRKPITSPPLPSRITGCFALKDMMVLWSMFSLLIARACFANYIFLKLETIHPRMPLATLMDVLTYPKVLNLILFFNLYAS